MSHTLQKCLSVMSKLPGLGTRSGRRALLHLLKHRERELPLLIESLIRVQEKIRPCNVCGMFDEMQPCMYCQDPERKADQICVVEEASDVWSLERTHSYKGTYHVLHGVLSAIDGISPQHLNIESLIKRCRDNPPREIILALSGTVEGHATNHYLVQCLQPLGSFQFTTLARGVPLGGTFEFLDEGTLQAALSGRKPY